MDSATVLQAAGSSEEAIPQTLPSGTERPGAQSPASDEPRRDQDTDSPADAAEGDQSADSRPTATAEPAKATPGGSDSPGIETTASNTAAVGEPGASDLAEDEPAPEPATKETDEAAGRDGETAAALKAEGNAHFVAGRLEEALALYAEAIEHAPLRPEESSKLAAMHANRAACLLGLSRYEECIAACDDCLDLDPRYIKAMLRRVKALEKLDMLDEAQQDYEDILEEFPGNVPAKQGLERLQASQKEKEEKLKTEMLDKLKGVGNSLLGHFGLSLDNFKVDQDAKTGGYSINFQQGPAAEGGAPK